MEHIFVEVQLCIEMLIFKEKHVFPILIILCSGTSLVKGTLWMGTLAMNSALARVTQHISRILH